MDHVAALLANHIGNEPDGVHDDAEASEKRTRADRVPSRSLLPPPPLVASRAREETQRTAAWCAEIDGGTAAAMTAGLPRRSRRSACGSRSLLEVLWSQASTGMPRRGGGEMYSVAAS